MTSGTVNPVLVRVAQRTQPKKLAAFMRKMADYIVFTLPEQLDNVSLVRVVPSSCASSSADLTTCHVITIQAVMYLNKLIWEYTLFPLDRLVMCMVCC